MEQQSRDNTRQRLETVLEELWLSNLGLIQERLSALRRMQRQLEEQQIDQETREEAAGAAHRLAGILGTFGLPQGTELARFIEQKLDSSEPIHSAEASSLTRMIDRLGELIKAKSLPPV